MKTSTILPAAIIAGVAHAGIFPDCVNGPLANTTVCNPNACKKPVTHVVVKAYTVDSTTSKR